MAFNPYEFERAMFFFRMRRFAFYYAWLIVVVVAVLWFAL